MYFLVRPASVWRKRLTAYAFACLISGLTLAVRLELAPWIGGRPLLILFILPIIFSAYAGGLGPGLVSTALSALGVGYFLLPRARILFYEGSVDLWQWVMFIVIGVLVSVLVEALHRSRRQVGAAGYLQAVTLASIGDAVITTDEQARVTFMNAEAERLTEWKNPEGRGRSLAEVFRVLHEQTRQPMADPGLQVLQTGAVVELANHALLLGRNGRETLIEDSGAPIKGEDGQVAGVVLVFRDCTEKKRAEDALRESQALYHSLVEQMPAGVFRKDAEGRYVFVNPFLCQLRGIAPEQYLGKLPQELPDVGVAFRVRAGADHEQIMRTGRPVEVPEELPRADGTTVHLHVVKTAVFDAAGKIIGSQGILFDITERKNSEQAVRDRERLLRQVIDLVPHFIFAKDSSSRHLFVNRACAEAAGLTVEEMTGRTDLEFLADPEQARAFIRDDREVLESGQPKFIPEERLKGPDGRERILETIKIPFTMPGLSEPAVLGVAVDITERKRLEEELRTAGERMKFYMNRMPLGFIAWDRELHVAEWNAAAETIFGWTAAEATGRHANELMVPPERRSQVDSIWELTMTVGNVSSRIVNDNVTRDGRRIICEWRIAPWRTAGGEVCGCLCIVGDITEHRQAEEKFTREQARFKLIFDTMPIGIAFHTTHPDGHCTRTVNDAHLRMCGLTRRQHDEPGIYARITPPEDYARQRHFVEQVRAGERRQFSMEKRYLHPDGKVVWVNFSYQREGYGDGTIEELITVMDITERTTAEQQLRQLAVIVESSEDAIIGSDLAGVITSWNRGAEIIFGYSAAETVGHARTQLNPPELQGEAAEVLARITQRGSSESFQTERVRKDGKRIRISATISPLRDGQGRVVGAATIARDTTRQQMLEEQLRQSQKMEAIGQLAGGVAHDFNNILAVIQMQVELWKMEVNLSADQGACVDEILTAANRGANLTRQLLLFSRRQRLQPREVDLSDSIAGMTKMLLRVLGEDIQIQFQYAPEPLFIRADAGMMDQVLMNLTLNSRDAMPGGGKLTIETAMVDMDELAALQSVQARPGAFARLSVTDTGSGIPPEILPRIFEPFFTTKDVGKGTGLGLATVFSIVQQHQGWINVVSEPGRGNNLDFPRLTQAPVERPDVIAAPAVTGGQETILLVEDDEALRASVRKCLTQLGYRLLEAASGVAALQVWQQQRGEIHLLLTDLVMPGGLTGRELGEQLRRESPALKVVYVSGYSADIFTHDFPQTRGVTFLAKPFPAQLLARTVRACLDGK